MASSLDPRFKELPFLDDDDRERTFLRLVNEAAALIPEPSNVSYKMLEIYINTTHTKISDASSFECLIEIYVFVFY